MMYIICALTFLFKIIGGSNWCDKNQHCKKSIGLPRYMMPQLSKNNKISQIFKKIYINPLVLIPFQYDIYTNKVNEIVEYYKKNKLAMKNIDKEFNNETKILIAKNKDGNYFIIDGHHRWASLIELNKLNAVPIKLVCYLSPFNEVVTWRLIHVTENTLCKSHMTFLSSRS